MGRMVEKNERFTETYKAIYRDEGLTQVGVAKVLGLKGQSGVGVIIERGATLNHLYKLIKGIGGYRVAIEKVGDNGETVRRYTIGGEHGDGDSDNATHD